MGNSDPRLQDPMPLLSYHSALSLDFRDLLRNVCNTMTSLLWYLAAFGGAAPAIHGAVAGQYLLGLGERSSSLTQKWLPTSLVGIGDITGYMSFNLDLLADLDIHPDLSSRRT